MAAITNEIEIAGPANRFAADPVSTKSPPPIVTPTPNTTRSRAPRFFFSWCSGFSVSRIDCSIDLVLKISMAASRQDPPPGRSLRNRAGSGLLERQQRAAPVERRHVLDDCAGQHLRGQPHLLQDRRSLGVLQESLRDAVQPHRGLHACV